MKYLCLFLSLSLILGCAQDQNKSRKKNPPEPNITVVYHDRLKCHEVYECEEICFDRYPFITEWEIKEWCKDQRIYPDSSFCLKKIRDHALNEKQYNGCVELWADDVLGYYP